MKSDKAGTRPSKLTVESIFGIKSAEIEFNPNRNVFQLFGKNGSGKSSLSNALWFAVMGVRGPRQGGKEGIIHDDSAEGIAELHLQNGLVVTRSAKRGPDGEKFSLYVSTPEGARFPSPQKMLDKMLGEKGGVDPMAFANAKPADMADMLLSASGLYHEIVEYDRQMKTIEGERVLWGRDRDKAKGALEDAGPLDEEAGFERVDTAAILAELQEVSRGETNRKLMDGQIAEKQRERARLAAQLEELMERLKGVDRELDALYGSYNALPDAPDTSALEARLANAEEINVRVAANENRKRLIAEYNAAADKWDECQKFLEEVRTKKREAIFRIEMPDERMTFSEDLVVMWNGRPLDQASFAQRMEAGCVLAMDDRATFRVIAIEQGGELDEETFARIEQKAEERDYMVLVQKVSSSWDGTGFYIEDGFVTASEDI